MRESCIWSAEPRHVWTVAFGLILPVLRIRELEDERWLDEAEHLVAEVDRRLGRRRGVRIGEAPDRDGQYYHYLVVWIFVPWKPGAVRSSDREQAAQIVRDVHSRFVVPGVSVIWKMQEDLSAPYPGQGPEALDPFHGYVGHRIVDPVALGHEILELATFVERSWRTLRITQDLGPGRMLWMPACRLTPLSRRHSVPGVQPDDAEDAPP